MNKTVLITGAATRIGRVLASGLASDGWRVAIHYNSSGNAAQKLAQEIGNAVTVQADLSEAQDLKTLMVRTTRALKAPVTALINNASTYTPDDAVNYSEEAFDLHLSVNLKAPLALAQQFAKQLPGGEKGCIVNIIDQRVLRPAPDFFTYSVSKSALYAATKTMAQNFAPNIRVNAIGPGPTLKSVYQSEAEFTNEAKNTLLGTGSPPDTILHAARYLLSASAVTGQMIAVDCGQHLAGRERTT